MVFPAAAPTVGAEPFLLRGDVQPHEHEFMELALVLGGRAVHRTLDGTQRIGRGWVLVLRPGVWHAYEDCRELSVFNVYAGMELLADELAWLGREPAAGWLLWDGPLSSGRRGMLLGRIHGARVERCRVALGALRRSTRPSSGAAASERIGRLLTALGLLGQSLRAGWIWDGRCLNAQQAQSGDPGSRGMPPILIQGLRLLDDSLARAWTLDGLSAALALSPAQVTRLFRFHTGLPPMRYLARRRAERAASLLLRTRWPIGRVGALVGWPDPNYFARRFRAHFGVPASRYRRTMRDRTGRDDRPGSVA